MTVKLNDYIAAGKELATEDRLEAAHQLLMSVDSDTTTDQESVDKAWSAVVDRRLEEVLSGSAELVDGRAAHARVRENFHSQQQVSADDVVR